MVNEKLFYIGQKALIEREGEVLVLFTHKGGIDFPGGKIQEGETDIAQSLRREVKEETQLDISIGNPFRTWQLEITETSLLKPIYFVAFECKYLKGDTIISNEHEKFIWVNKENYHQIDDNSVWFKVLRTYFEMS